MSPINPSLLFLRPDCAGDAIKTLPALRALKKQDLGLGLHVLASQANASIFEFEPGIALHVLPPHWKRMKSATLRAALQQSHLPTQGCRAVNLMCDPSEGLEMLIASLQVDQVFSVNPLEKLSGIQLLKLPDETPANRDEVANIAILIEQVIGKNLLPDLYLQETAPVLSEQDHLEALDKMGSKKGPWLGFCPTAGTRNRSHPLKKWQKFVRRVTEEEGFEKFFLFGTPSDYPTLNKLRDICNERDRIELCFPSSFRALGAYLKRLDGVVTVDSGPLHLARAMGVKSLGFLSGGDTERWFHRLKEGERLLRRGILNRFPSALEMSWAFDKWRPAIL